AGHQLAARGFDVEAGFVVLHALGEVEMDPAESIDHGSETGKVGFHEVIDRNMEVLLDRLHELPGASVESGVDPVGGSRPCNRYPGVAGNREHFDARRLRDEPNDD